MALRRQGRVSSTEEVLSEMDKETERDDGDEKSKEEPARRPYKLVDVKREVRKGVMAGSLEELLNTACQKLEIASGCNVRIVLEQDGTEIDDEEYFSTLEGDTVLMLLKESERWLPVKQIRSWSSLDQTDSSEVSCLEELVGELYHDLSALPWLSGKELEALAEMDVENVLKVVPDRRFLQTLQDASARYLAERQEACEAISFLEMYRKFTATSHQPPQSQSSVSSGGESK